MLFNSGRAVRGAARSTESFARARDDDAETFPIEPYDSGPADPVPRASAKAVAVAELNNSRSVADEMLLEVVVVLAVAVVEPRVDGATGTLRFMGVVVPLAEESTSAREG